MEVHVAGTCFHLSQLLPNGGGRGGHPSSSSAAARASFFASSSSSSSSSNNNNNNNNTSLALKSLFLGVGSTRLYRARSLAMASAKGRGRRWKEERTRRRAFIASIEWGDDDSFGGANDEEEEELVQWIQELAFKLRQDQEAERQASEAIHSRSTNDDDASSISSVSMPIPPPPPPLLFRKSEPTAIEPPWRPVQPEPPDWADQIVPACVEKNASRLGLPLSLRIIKERKKKQQQWGGSFQEAAESAWCCSVKRAFSSMVFMIRELQSYALQLREALFYEDLQGILERVRQEMNSSFVWLFQQIFSATPVLMLSVMLLLADFTVYSLGHNAAAIVALSTNPPPSQSVLSSVIHDDQQHQKNASYSKTFAIGRTASVEGSGGGSGGKLKPVFGSTDDGRSDGPSSSHGIILSDDISKAPATAHAEKERSDSNSADEAEAERAWKEIVEEAHKMKARTRDEALTDPETLRRLVAPVTVELEPEDPSDYLQTQLMYEKAVYAEPHNALLLANFAQFLYLVLRDHDRAELYFKKAIRAEPGDGEALSRYAGFLWKARQDLTAAEETYLEAITADPSNHVHAANYAHFLWKTGGADTCYPLDDDDDAP